MNRWERVGLSFICAIAAELLVDGFLCRLQYGSDWKLQGFLLFAAMELIFVIPCWLLILPMVICFGELNGWRFWILTGIGTAIGPLSMICWMALVGNEKPTQIHYEDLRWLVAAFSVSFLTTISYVGLVKFSSRAAVFNQRHDR